MHEVHEEELAKVQLDHRGLVSRNGSWMNSDSLPYFTSVDAPLF